MNNHTPESGLSFERVVFFSDAVFAIVITLLVLELKVPHITEHTEPALRHALFELLPRVAGFVISFLIIGLMWIEHHRIFRYIADSILLAPISFAFIPMFARLLDPASKKSKQEPATA